MTDLKKIRFSYGLKIKGEGANKVSDTNLYLALESIRTGGKDGAFIETIQKIRSASTKEERDELKYTLPYFVYSGLFDGIRDEEHLIAHSGIVCIEWDKVENYQELKQSLKHNNYILSVFLSPSNGVKALIKIANPDKHAEHYNALISTFNEYAPLDTSSRNISRVQYLSYDPDIYINPESFVFADVLDSSRDREGNSRDGNMKYFPSSQSSSFFGAYENYDYSKLNIATKMVAMAEDGEKHNVLNKAGFLLGGYVKTGVLNFDMAVAALDIAIEQKPNVSDLNAAKSTIRRSVKEGMDMPIYAIDALEKEVAKDYKILEMQNDFIVSKDDLLSAVTKIASGYTTPTYSSGWEGLDTHFIWKPNRLITNLAHDGVGKTSVALYMMLAAAVNHGWKFMIYASENENDALFVDLMQWVIGKYIIGGEKRRAEWVMDTSEKAYAFDFVHEHFKFIKNAKPYTPEELLEKTSKELSKKSFNYIMIDPFNSLINKSKSSDNTFITNTTTMFEQYSKTDCGIWVNLHTRADARRNRGEDGLLKAPEKNDGEYGTMWSNKAHCALVSHRNPDDRARWMETHLMVKKEKTTQTGGSVHFQGDSFKITMNYLTFVDDFDNMPFKFPYQELHRIK